MEIPVVISFLCVSAAVQSRRVDRVDPGGD